MLKSNLRGWLVVNTFLDSPKFEEIYARLIRAFSLRGVPLVRKGNAELVSVLGLPVADLPDFALFWDKDIPLARHLENLGLRLFNRGEAIALCDDKAETALAFERGGIAQPKTVIAPLKFTSDPYPNDDFLDSVAGRLGFPLVMKERVGSFGAQVSLARNVGEIRAVMHSRPAASWLFQEYIASSFGRDLRIQTLGGKAVAAAARYGAPNDFRSNVTAGGRMEPIDPPQTFIELAVRTAEHLRLDFAGIDILYGEEETPLVCEVNSNAHFVNLDNALGIRFEEMLADYVIETLLREKETPPKLC